MRKTKRKNNLEQIQGQVVIAGIIFMACIVLGAYLNKLLPNKTNGVLENVESIVDYYNSSLNLVDTIILNIKSDLLFLGGISISSLLVITSPILMIIFMLKGLSIGYTINTLVLVLKLDSIKMILLMLFKNIIIIPGAIMLALISIKYIKEVLENMKIRKKENVLFFASRYVLNSFIIILVSIVLQTTLNAISISVLQFIVR